MKLIYSKFYCLEAFCCFKMWQKPVLGSEYGPPKNSPQFSTAFKYSTTVNGFLRHLSTPQRSTVFFIFFFLPVKISFLYPFILLLHLVFFSPFLRFPLFTTSKQTKNKKKGRVIIVCVPIHALYTTFFIIPYLQYSTWTYIPSNSFRAA